MGTSINNIRHLILEKSVESRKSAQALDPYSYMKKVFITNKVTLILTNESEGNFIEMPSDYSLIHINKNALH